MQEKLKKIKDYIVNNLDLLEYNHTNNITGFKILDIEMFVRSSVLQGVNYYCIILCGEDCTVDINKEEFSCLYDQIQKLSEAQMKIKSDLKEKRIDLIIEKLNIK